MGTCRLSLVLPALLLAAPARAEVREDGQVWFQAVAQGQVAGDLVYFAELQPRFSADSSVLAQMLIRPAIGVKLTDRLTVY